jgi:hypothetical protein
MELLNLTQLFSFIGLVTKLFLFIESRQGSGIVRRHFFVLRSSLVIRNCGQLYKPGVHDKEEI